MTDLYLFGIATFLIVFGLLALAWDLMNSNVGSELTSSQYVKIKRFVDEMPKRLPPIYSILPESDYMEYRRQAKDRKEETKGYKLSYKEEKTRDVMRVFFKQVEFTPFRKQTPKLIEYKEKETLFDNQEVKQYELS